MNASKVLKTTNLVTHAMDLARQAGEIQMKYFRSGHLSVDTKQGEADIVTKADRESEKLIVEGILAQYPDHGILSEESGAIGDTAEWMWIVDPLDGTTNYTAGLPIFAVSIGICRNDEIVGGVVYNPVLDEMFSAVKGLGAFLNGQKIHVRDNDRIDRAVVATGFPVDKDVNPDNNLDNVAKVLPRVRGLRRLGAASVDMCYVAAGILDAYWEMNLHEWDVCAGTLMVEEAGGHVHRYRGDRNVSLLASSPGMYHKLKAMIK